MGKNKPIFNSSEQYSKKEIKHLLVVRLSALGDVAIMIPVLRVFSKSYPSVKLTVVSKAFFKPLFSEIPNLSFFEADVYGQHKGILGLQKLVNTLDELQIDAVADLHHVLRSNILKLFFKLKGIPVVQIDKGRKEKRALIRKTKKVFIPLKATHQRYADVFRTLGFPLDLSQHQFPPQKELLPKITETTETKNKKWIGIAPFAAYKSKMYPLELMEKVIAHLNNTYPYTIFLFGGGQEEVSILKSIAKNYKNTIAIAGRYTLEEELSLMAHLDLMLAMDSGNAHLAALHNIPTITLWGVTHPFAGFYPFGQPSDRALLPDREKYPLLPTSIYGNTYPKEYENIMQSIPPMHVIDKILEILL